MGEDERSQSSFQLPDFCAATTFLLCHHRFLASPMAGDGATMTSILWGARARLGGVGGRQKFATVSQKFGRNSSFEDPDLGRLVRKNGGIPCKWVIGVMGNQLRRGLKSGHHHI
jgi:hypothetical protein